MATASFVVTSAMQEIGATSIIKPAAPENTNASFQRLLQMFSEWASKDIDLGDNFVLPANLAAEMSNDDNTTLAIIHGLMKKIAPFLRKTLTADQKVNAYASYQDLLISAVIRPEMPFPSTLNRGAGRRTIPFARTYYVAPQRKDPQTVEPDPQ